MSLVLQLNLVPSLSPAPTLQRYVRGALDVVGASTGSAITGTVHATYTSLWEFNFTGVAAGDYWCIVSGVSTPNAPPFPVRVTTVDVGAANYWAELDSWLTATPNIPSPITGLCNVLFSLSANGTAVVGAACSATLEGVHNTTDGVLVARSVTSGTTDSSGNCTLTLIQGGQFIVGGSYRIVVSSANVLHVNRLVTIPSTSTANAEDLVSA